MYTPILLCQLYTISVWIGSLGKWKLRSVHPHTDIDEYWFYKHIFTHTVGRANFTVRRSSLKFLFLKKTMGPTDLLSCIVFKRISAVRRFLEVTLLESITHDFLSLWVVFVCYLLLFFDSSLQETDHSVECKEMPRPLLPHYSNGFSNIFLVHKAWTTVFFRL